MDGSVELLANTSAAVLAGGLSRRMGCDKVRMPFAGQPLVLRVLTALRGLFDDVYLVGGPSVEGFKTEPDILPGRGNLIGIHAALYASRTPRVFVTAADLPFPNLPLIRMMASLEGDVVIPRHDGRYEPLYAFYSRSCLEAIEAAIRERRWRASGFLDTVATTVVEEETLRRYDPTLLCFSNVNTPDDYLQALAHLAHRNP